MNIKNMTTSQLRNRKEELKQILFKSEHLEKLISLVKEQYERIISEKDIRIAEFKEGRILSTANRAFVKGVADNTYKMADELVATGDRLMELYNATEPPGKIEVEEGKQLVEIEDTKESRVTVDVVDMKKEERSDLTPEQVGEIVETALTKALSGDRFVNVIKEGQEMAYKKLMGKVE